MFRVKHAGGEVIPDASLVAQLLREQFPQLAGENVRPSNAEGSSNFVYRVGDECAVRLPRSDSYIADLLSEARCPRCGSSPSHPPCSRGPGQS
jgi:aminoglycoside phosphotransferase (APT) family kinase protein